MCLQIVCQSRQKLERHPARRQLVVKYSREYRQLLSFGTFPVKLQSEACFPLQPYHSKMLKCRVFHCSVDTQTKLMTWTTYFSYNRAELK